MCSAHTPALLLYCFTLLCFTTALVHTPLPGYYCADLYARIQVSDTGLCFTLLYYSADLCARIQVSALLCFTYSLYSALLCFTMRHYCGYRSQDKGFRLAGALQHVFVPQVCPLLCFTLLYTLCSTSWFRRSALLCFLFYTLYFTQAHVAPQDNFCVWGLTPRWTHDIPSNLI